MIQPLRTGCLTGTAAGGVGSVADALAVRAGAAAAGRGSTFGAGAAGCSLARGRPANGMVAADAVCVVPDFTLRVLTITGRIGSLEPGVAGVAAAVAGGSSFTGAVPVLARLKRWVSLPDWDAGSAAGGVVRCTVRAGSAFAGASAIIGAVRLVEAWAKCSPRSWRMRA